MPGNGEKARRVFVTQHNLMMPHSAFEGQTPDEMYFGPGAPQCAAPQLAGEAAHGAARGAAYGGSQVMAGRASVAGSGGTSGAGAAADSASVSIAVTTMPLGGRHKPRNIGAIWGDFDSSAGTQTLTPADVTYFKELRR